MTTTDQATVSYTTSRDGTKIGYFTTGDGPPLVLVHGALGDHSRWDVLRPHLEPHFTVHAMDRRGRGASGDSADYDVAREVEDVNAVVDAVASTSGAAVDMLCSSAGASFAVSAAAQTTNVRRLVLFEPPARQVLELLPAELLDQLDALLAADDREGLLRLAYRVLVGLSDEEIENLRAQPAWPNRLAAAHTVPRELRIPRTGCSKRTRRRASPFPPWYLSAGPRLHPSRPAPGPSPMHYPTRESPFSTVRDMPRRCSLPRSWPRR